MHILNTQSKGLTPPIRIKYLIFTCNKQQIINKYPSSEVYTSLIRITNLVLFSTENHKYPNYSINVIYHNCITFAEKYITVVPENKI